MKQIRFSSTMIWYLKKILESNSGEWVKPFNKSNKNMIRSPIYLINSQLEKSKWEISNLFEIGVFDL